jgi:tetratricopeptide (TPR) repeat protein
MLEMAANEHPNDDRVAYYYGRELVYMGEYEKAYTQLNHHLQLPTAVWKAERSASKRLLAKCKPEEAEYWLLGAAAEAPERRESWVDLAQMYYEKGRWAECYSAVMSALAITNKAAVYTMDPSVWTEKPYDLASIACWHLGMKDKAVEYCKQALEFNPSDSRLIRNLEQMTEEQHV